MNDVYSFFFSFFFLILIFPVNCIFIFLFFIFLLLVFSFFCNFSFVVVVCMLKNCFYSFVVCFVVFCFALFLFCLFLLHNSVQSLSDFVEITNILAIKKQAGDAVNNNKKYKK